LSCRFRDLASGEVEALVDLWVEAWNATLPTIDFETRHQWFHERLSRLALEDFTIRCAFIDDRQAPAGFIAISQRLRYLDQIAVRPRHWGKGIAAELMEQARLLCPKGIILDVNQNNHRAIAFYEKRGFTRLRADRNPESGRPTWWYVWGEAKPPRS
jgi:putative acetyltransferase